MRIGKNLYLLDNFWQNMASVLCSDFKGRKIVYTQGTRCLIVLTDFAMQQSERAILGGLHNEVELF